MAFYEPPSRMPLRRSPVCCRVWDSRRLTTTNSDFISWRTQAQQSLDSIPGAAAVPRFCSFTLTVAGVCPLWALGTSHAALLPLTVNLMGAPVLLNREIV